MPVIVIERNEFIKVIIARRILQYRMIMMNAHCMVVSPDSYKEGGASQGAPPIRI